MRLLCDVDGILADWADAVVQRIEDISGRRITPDECDGWLKLNRLGLSPHILESIEWELRSVGFCKELQILPGAVAGVEMVHKLGWEVVYVTAPWESSDTWESERRKWLHKNKFPGPIVSTSEKYMVKGHVFIDDNLENVVQWQNHNKQGKAYLWTTDWNRKLNFSQRLNGWAQLMEVLSKCQTTIIQG